MYQTKFKGEIFEGIVELTKQIASKILVGYVIFYGILMLIMSFLVMGLLKSTGFTMVDLQNPEAITELVESIVYGGINGKFLFGIIIFYLLMILVSCWHYYFSFKVAQNEVLNQPLSLGEALANSLDNRLFQLLLFIILLGLGLFSLFTAITAIFTLTGVPALVFVGILIGLTISIKLCLALPAFILGDKTMIEAVSFSFVNMTLIRVVKIIGVLFLVFIVFLLLALVVGIISGLFSFIPYFDQVISFVFNALIGGVVMAFMVAAATALYYRYSDNIDSGALEIQDHLVDGF